MEGCDRTRKERKRRDKRRLASFDARKMGRLEFRDAK